MSYIKGNYRRSIYQNSQGYNIGLFKVMDTDDEKLADYIAHTITFTGYFHELNDMDTYDSILLGFGTELLKYKNDGIDDVLSCLAKYLEHKNYFIISGET